MKRRLSIAQLTFMLFILLSCMNNMNCYGQNARIRRNRPLRNDSTETRFPMPTDSLSRDSLQAAIPFDSIAGQNEMALKSLLAPVDTAALTKRQDSIASHPVITKNLFVPDSKKATWFALVFPGGGQIYNRKYWKLPIFYGGFVGCAYALNWNGRMYKDYKQAYLDIMDDDPNSKSYENFLPAGYDISGQETQFQERFKKRKDAFRRQRDMSIFAFIAVYALSVIDAYVDAELSDFDISHDLGLKIEPTLINNGYKKNLYSIGLQCSLTF